MPSATVLMRSPVRLEVTGRVAEETPSGGVAAYSARARCRQRTRRRSTGPPTTSRRTARSRRSRPRRRCRTGPEQVEREVAAGLDPADVESAANVGGLPPRVATPGATSRAFGVAEYGKGDLVPHQEVRDQVVQQSQKSPSGPAVTRYGARSSASVRPSTRLNRSSWSARIRRAASTEKSSVYACPESTSSGGALVVDCRKSSIHPARAVVRHLGAGAARVHRAPATSAGRLSSTKSRNSRRRRTSGSGPRAVRSAGRSRPAPAR